MKATPRGSGDERNTVDHSNNRDGFRENRPEPPDLIIEAGILITMTREQPVLRDVSIEIKSGVIRKIGKGKVEENARGRGIQRIDARKFIVMPGLVNSHTHAAMTLFRGIGDDLPLRTWLFEKIFPIEAAFVNPGMVYLGTLLACLEMLASGTTCFLDGYFFEGEAMKAANDAGMRGVMAQGGVDLPAPGVPDPSQNLKTARQFLERYSGWSKMIRPGIFCHSPLTCSSETLRKVSLMCEEYGSPLFIHLAETSAEVKDLKEKTGLSPGHYMDSLGLLSSCLVCVHCIFLDPDEIELFASKKVRVVNVPESNMKLASGLARTLLMMRKGLRPGLGTDGCASNNNLDILGETKAASRVSTLNTRDPGVIDDFSLLCMATVWGAELAGISDIVGSIEVGKEADIITIDTRHPRMWPMSAPLHSMVHHCDAGLVKDVIIKGEVLLRGGMFTRIEPMDVIKEVEAFSRSVRAFMHSS